MSQNVRIGNLEQELIPVGTMAMVTVTDTAAAVTLPAGASHVLLQAQAQPLMYRIDGGVPTATAGFLLAAGQKVLLRVKAAQELRVIREGGTNARLAVQGMNL